MRLTRRTLLKSSLGSAGLLAAAPAVHARRGAFERLDLGVIGVGGRGAENLAAVAGENVVALCDVDATALARAGERFPAARRFADFRRMLDAVRLDAVVVSTPDHTHAVATMAALARGLHVYCEKPLAHSVAETRIVTETAHARRLVTQMGTQIHAGANYRRVVELVRSGAIGAVSAVHVWCDKSWGGTAHPIAPGAAPAHLDWDLWLGPALDRPFSPAFAPGTWRRYWDFGGGTLSDMACHYMDLPFWALALRHAEEVEATGPAADAVAAPSALSVRWRFPARGDAPPVELTWHDGGRRPAALSALGIANWKNGVLFLGDHGGLVADYEHHALLPADRGAVIEPPEPWIADSIGHHAEWIAACKGEGTTTCPFEYAGPLTETVLLGNVAHRAGAPLAWDAASFTERGPEGADALLYDDYRGGWSL